MAEDAIHRFREVDQNFITIFVMRVKIMTPDFGDVVVGLVRFECSADFIDCSGNKVWRLRSRFGIAFDKNT